MDAIQFFYLPKSHSQLSLFSTRTTCKMVLNCWKEKNNNLILFSDLTRCKQWGCWWTTCASTLFWLWMQQRLRWWFRRGESATHLTNNLWRRMQLVEFRAPSGVPGGMWVSRYWREALSLRWMHRDPWHVNLRWEHFRNTSNVKSCFQRGKSHPLNPPTLTWHNSKMNELLIPVGPDKRSTNCESLQS